MVVGFGKVAKVSAQLCSCRSCRRSMEDACLSGHAGTNRTCMVKSITRALDPISLRRRLCQRGWPTVRAESYACKYCRRSREHMACVGRCTTRYYFSSDGTLLPSLKVQRHACSDSGPKTRDLSSSPPSACTILTGRFMFGQSQPRKVVERNLVRTKSYLLARTPSSEERIIRLAL